LDLVFIGRSIKHISQYALELNWSVGTTWRFARDDPYSEISLMLLCDVPNRRWKLSKVA
jgi:hypothetical protein